MSEANGTRLRQAADNVLLVAAGRVAMIIALPLIGLVWQSIGGALLDLTREIKTLHGEISQLQKQVAVDAQAVSDYRRRIENLERDVRGVADEQRRRTDRVYGPRREAD